LLRDTKLPVSGFPCKENEMHKHYAKFIVASVIAVFALPAHACGMPASPGLSNILCIDTPLEGLIAFSLLAAVLVGLDSVIRKGIRMFRRSTD
jgi:hypothetical protein